MKKGLLWGAFLIFAMGCTHQQEMGDAATTTRAASDKCNDKELEATVSQLLQSGMKETDCTKGLVYVVETETGAIKAKVALAAKGKKFVPFEDTYNEEQKDMMMGPTYLALLSTGEILPEYRIDTGSGIYKDVIDYNWYRGGWGIITVEEAFYLCSRVGFTRLKEDAFRGNTAAFDRKISTYLANMPDSPLGMLTFYNAVANDGKMVKLTTEGGDITVLNEKIAEPEHIKMLQQGMRKAVETGLLKKAGRCNAAAAASGRSFEIGNGYRRMELFGHFPIEKPQYTVMVIMEKKSLPASAGRMCAPIMASIVDKLTIEKVTIN